jgi:hypothetical protein
LFAITVDGVIPMTEMLSTDRTADNRVSPFAQIMDTVRGAVKSYQSNFGWQFIAYPRGHLGILNVPVIANNTAQQYVINVLTGAPCRFLGMNANVWELYNDAMYFGANDGNVYLFDTDAADGTTPITATLQTAWNYFGKRGMRKKFNSVRMLITTDHAIEPGIGLNVDYGTGGAVTIPSSGAGVGSQWDVAIWDSSQWSQEAINHVDWHTVAGEGFAASVTVQATSAKQGVNQGVILQLNAIDINMEPGGML